MTRFALLKTALVDVRDTKGVPDRARSVVGQNVAGPPVDSVVPSHHNDSVTDRVTERPSHLLEWIRDQQGSHSKLERVVKTGVIGFHTVSEVMILSTVQ